GGIASYKSPEIVRRLTDHGIEVRVVMTKAACEFIRPLVFQAVSGHAVSTELLDEDAEAGMGHIELARWADVLLIAPATANTLAGMAAGLANDLLLTICLATTARQVVAPAMNSMMWHHAATLANVDTLKSRGVVMLGPDAGSQACGETGVGRMLEPADIVQAMVDYRDRQKVSTSLDGVRVLITAGPTREDIDPVRFISNHSSGKMGFALARAAQMAGAQVTLVAGPVRLDTPSEVSRVDVVSASAMHDAVMDKVDATDIFIAVAAVADYRAAQIFDSKIKKSADDLTLTLQRNADILADVAALDRRPMCVGFAAETDNLEGYARDKLQRKKLDMIVANRVGVADGGFNSDANAVEVFWPDGSQSFPSRSKQSLALELINLIATRYQSA
ncbi:MAG: bifunctional phosphopantothenoylcysteine decarboxylase/phosphopantothenate--cysteine ligase CoaBC, partial [Pseudomonadota bacterium]